MISHNKEFYGALCTEEWIIEDGKLSVVGEVSFLAADDSRVACLFTMCVFRHSKKKIARSIITLFTLRRVSSSFFL